MEYICIFAKKDKIDSKKIKYIWMYAWNNTSCGLD